MRSGSTAESTPTTNAQRGRTHQRNQSTPVAAWSPWMLHKAPKGAHPQAHPESRVCIRDPTSSRNFASRSDLRASPRPSSSLEPRHPSLRVVVTGTVLLHLRRNTVGGLASCGTGCWPQGWRARVSGQESTMDCRNDPSAGSPTETLLRLLLPLSDKVH